MLTGFIVVIILYVHIWNHYVIHLKLTQVYVNYILIKLGEYKITKKLNHKTTSFLHQLGCWGGGGLRGYTGM